MIDAASASLIDALAQYRAVYMASRNLALRSRREYATDIQDLITFLESRCFVHSPARVERTHLESYLAELDNRGFTGNTRRRKVATIRSFFTYLFEADVIPHNPSQKLIPPAREILQPRVLTEAEYKRLQLACAHETRDAAIIELLLQTGIRLSELARLTLANFELPARISKDEGHVGSVHIYCKGRKDRTITLNWKACKAIRSYLAIRPKLEDQHLFITKFGAGISPRAIENVVDKYLQEAGIANASVHTLRHTFGTHMAKKGTKLDIIRQAMGHESLDTTGIYVHLARELMDKELQANAL